ncbi:hypothetical protein NXF25_008974 [Crotalus adamanteus]|uniref:Uncharacterized protein n=1 Tax=Crotalus adamanteus TaxID=8729 RepID=A0AAW1BQY8_CROAD
MDNTWTSMELQETKLESMNVVLKMRSQFQM